MKKTEKLLYLIPVLILAGCEGTHDGDPDFENPNPTDGYYIVADKTEIEANGEDVVTFKVYDPDGNDLTASTERNYVTIVDEVTGANIGDNVFEARRHQVRAHVGEVGITTIVVLGTVACLLQAAGYGRQVLRFTRIFHDACRGLCRITAQYRYKSAIGTKAVCIEVGEQHSFTGQAVHLHRNVGRAAQRRHQPRREAFQNHDAHVGPLRVEQGAAGHGQRIGRQGKQRVGRLYGSFDRRVNQGGKQPVGLVRLHEAVLAGKVFLFGQRLHQAEGRVGSSMVQQDIGTEINLTGVHRRHGKASTDRDKQQSRQQKQQERHAEEYQRADEKLYGQTHLLKSEPA